MKFDDVQLAVINNAKSYGERFNVKIDREFALLKLLEELGELAEAILTFEKKSRPDKFLPPEEAKKRLAMEIADVVGMAIVTADIFNVNLLEALDEKWIHRKGK